MENRAARELDHFCVEHSVPYRRLPILPRAEFDRTLTQTCTELPLDLLVLTFDKLLPASLVRSLRNRIINVHPALLPAFKGMHALEQTVSAGARYAGATIHIVDEEMDHGPIIAQCVVGTRPDDTASALGERIFPHLETMFLQVIAWYAAGRVIQHADGRVTIRDATYGTMPVSPALELPALTTSPRSTHPDS